MNSDAPAFLISPWLGRGAELHEAFVSAHPFPHVVIDEFLHADLAEELLAGFPDIGSMPKSRDYVFGDKHELSSVGEQGGADARFRDGVLTAEFSRFLTELSGHDVFVDPSFHGGGFHQGGDGSYLDMHVDFNVHPLHDDWLRTLNVLVYLNKDWPAEYGGDLLIKSRPDEEPAAIAPLFNRAVIMLTDERTFHGYRRMQLPPGRTRRSLAVYAYRGRDRGVRARTTGWMPEEAGLAKRMLARHYDTLVGAKTRFFGSGTARNR